MPRDSPARLDKLQACPWWGMDAVSIWLLRVSWHPAETSVTLFDVWHHAAAEASSSGSTAASEAPSTSGAAATSDGGVHTTPLTSPRKEAQLTQAQYVEIYDRLINIFKSRPRDDWKKLIVFSKQWPQHRQGVLDR